MNLFRFIKEAAAFRKTVKTGITEFQKKESSFLNMSAEELSGLSDDELIHAVWSRTEHIVASCEDMEKGFRSLNNAQRIVYALNYMEIEVSNGGICQFFVNAGRMFAPAVSGYMGIIGAAEHQALYDGFIKKHQIDVNDLSSFDIETIDGFQRQYKRFPFDEYDNAFYKLHPLEKHLIPYIKAHLDKF